MTPRAIRLRDQAKQAGLWGGVCLMAGIAFAVFAHVCRLHEAFWPMMVLAFSSIGMLFATVQKLARMADKYRAAEREDYWEHKRFMDQFSHIYRD